MRIFCVNQSNLPFFRQRHERSRDVDGKAHDSDRAAIRSRLPVLGAGMKHSSERQVLAAAAHLVERFAAHDRDGYFACFAPTASFIFHTHPEILPSRAAYRTLWREWEKTAKFKVLSCRSSDASATMLADGVGLFTHKVETRVSFDGAEQTVFERESILFQKDEVGRWLAVHEHLSPLTSPLSSEEA